jgi:tetratricopeptide (TPR) repeat protein
MQLRSLVLAGAVVFGLTFVAHTGQAQLEQYQPPLCELNTGHFLIKNSTVYLKGATEEQDPAKVEKMLNDAKENLMQALLGDQADNPAAWYFLARYYFMTDDAVGADSAFDRAEQLAPDCETDIGLYRRTMWGPLINAGIDSLNAGAHETAKRLIGAAATIFEADNYGYYFLGVTHYNLGASDSAQHYFKETIRIGAIDSTRQQNIEAATFNIGVIYVDAGELDSAAVWYERYLELKPDDVQAIIGLATIYGELGTADRAAVMYDSALARADSLNENQLLQAGQDLFHGERHELAARAFSLFLERNPFHRDGLYNLTNSYLAIAQQAGEEAPERTEAAQAMEEVARRLVGVEPLGHEAQRLLAASFALRKLEDSTQAVIRRVDGQSLSIEVFRSDLTDGGFAVKGTISNMKSTVTVLPTISFEFLDQQGNVVASETLSIAQLDAHANQDFEVTAVAEDIVAWRYTVGT